MIGILSNLIWIPFILIVFGMSDIYWEFLIIIGLTSYFVILLILFGILLLKELFDVDIR